MKTLSVPFAGTWTEADPEERKRQLVLHGSRLTVDSAGWSDLFPYIPDTEVFLAASETCLYLLFRCSGEGIRATVTEDNGPVCQDSCVECFLQLPDSPGYFNIEANCIGTVLAGYRIPGKEKTRFTSAELASVGRYPSMERKPVEAAEGTCRWDLLLEIPFRVLGLTRRPERIRANFYKCGDRTSFPHYVSWNPVLSEKPCFHLPEFFGELRFGETESCPDNDAGNPNSKATCICL